LHFFVFIFMKFVKTKSKIYFPGILEVHPRIETCTRNAYVHILNQHARYITWFLRNIDTLIYIFLPRTCGFGGWLVSREMKERSKACTSPLGTSCSVHAHADYLHQEINCHVYCLQIEFSLGFWYRIFKYTVLGVLCDLLLARVTAEKDSGVLKSASVRVWLTDLIFVENIDIPCTRSSMWYLKRTRVITEKGSVVLKGASVRVWLTDLTFVQNFDTLYLRSSVWFTARKAFVVILLVLLRICTKSNGEQRVQEFILVVQGLSQKQRQLMQQYFELVDWQGLKLRSVERRQRDGLKCFERSVEV